MPRRARLSIAGIPWHIIQRGNNRSACFYADEDYRRYLETLEEQAQKFDCAVHAYVLMTNHVHLLLTPTRTESAGLLMKHLGQRYVQYINRSYRRTGTSYGYDPQGRINAVSAGAQTLLTNIQYPPFGAATGWNWGNGSSYSRPLDSDGRIASFTLNGFTRTVSYDAASRIIGLNDATHQAFGYDSLDRLTSYTTPSANQNFSYDPVGNRLQLDDGGSIDSYSYAASSNRLTAISGAHAASYGYTANGNITADGANTYSYDPRNRLVSANASNYVLNGLGQRIEKQDSTAPAHGPGDADGDDAYTANDSTTILNQILQTGSASGNPDCNQDGQVNVQDLVCLNNQIASGAVPVSSGKVIFAYDEKGQVIGEYTGSGNAIEETVYLGSQPVAVLKQSNVYYIHTDQLNTPRVISDSTDKVVWRWDSDPFGTTAANDDPDLDGVMFTYNLRFPGQYYDAETGLHYNYYRYYDPSTGRYLTSDPIGLFASFNTYTYVEQNPVSATDPTGLARLNPSDFPGGLGGGGPFIQIINAPRSHGGGNTSAAFVEMAKIVGAIVIPPVAVGVAVASAPIASSITSGAVCRVAANPETQQTLIDFTTSLFPGTPTMNAAGVAGFAVGSATNPQEFLR